MAKKKPPSPPPVPEEAEDSILGEDDPTPIVPRPEPVKVTPVLRRGMGHRAARFEASVPSTKRLIGAPRAMPYSARALERYVTFVLDQLSLSQCVGEALARCLHVRILSTLPDDSRVSFPSRRYIYTLAREIERLTKDSPLLDTGSRPDLALLGMSLRGILREDLFPFSEALVNEPISLEAFSDADSFKVDGYFRLDSSGTFLVDDAKHALAMRFPFAMAVQVDDAFESYAAGSPPLGRPQGTIHGGHYVAVVGYEGNLFRVINSWGPGWGEGGFAWMTSEALAEASDHAVVSGTPPYAEVA